MSNVKIKEIFYATNNPGKIKDAQIVCIKNQVKLVLPKDLRLNIDPEETGTSYKENALIKARAFRPYVPEEIIVVGDDSGLEIPALNNEPGLHSRRWRDRKTPMSDAEIIEYCLERMKSLKGKDRDAHFVGTLVALDGGSKIVTAAAFLEGRIIEALQKNVPEQTGFPFRSLFKEKSSGKMIYELNENEIPTHRQRAFEQLFKKLNFS